MQMQQTYQDKVVPELQKELNIKNKLAVPKVEKIVINVGLGEAVKDKKVLGAMSEQIGLITGQKPIATK